MRTTQSSEYSRTARLIVALVMIDEPRRLSRFDSFGSRLHLPPSSTNDVPTYEKLKAAACVTGGSDCPAANAKNDALCSGSASLRYSKAIQKIWWPSDCSPRASWKPCSIVGPYGSGTKTHGRFGATTRMRMSLPRRAMSQHGFTRGSCTMVTRW